MKRVKIHMQKYISPSICCCDLSHLEESVRALEQLSVEYIHVDIMDGEFVSNYCLGTEFIPLLHRLTNIPLDIHLMITQPDRKLDYFSFLPGDIVSIHAESTFHAQKALAAIRARGAKAGLAINPATPVEHCKWVLEDLDVILIMTINPGFAGQKLVPQTLSKIAQARQLVNACGHEILLEVDGNVSFENAARMSREGANIFVAGTSSLYCQSGTLEERCRRLRQAIQANQSKAG